MVRGFVQARIEIAYADQIHSPKSAVFLIEHRREAIGIDCDEVWMRHREGTPIRHPEPEGLERGSMKVFAQGFGGHS